jgi:DNA/RNA-binding domain of Phe-tRNA-synthetase-like protein
MLILNCKYFFKQNVMKKFSIEPTILKAAPDYKGIALSCSLTNTNYDKRLWEKFDFEIELFRRQYVIEDIKELPGIYEMRKLYKRLGKDPNRYRPSAEALCRRILKDRNLYKINTLVDVINLISIHTGFSIGGFDCDKISGNLQFGVGVAGEKYDAIGRGQLNIEGLPVYRDNLGGIGTPTSDEERTKINIETRRLLMIINSADGTDGLEEALDLSRKFLIEYLMAKDIEVLWL